MMILAKTEPLIVAFGIMLTVSFLGIVILMVLFYHRVQQGKALIRTGMGGTIVSFNGIVALPLAHKIETVDLTVRKIDAAFRDQNSLRTRDGIEVEIVAAFRVSIGRRVEDILKVVGEHGAENGSKLETVSELFQARFAQALRAAVEECDFETIDARREEFRKIVREKIGLDLQGYTLHEIALDHFGKKD